MRTALAFSFVVHAFGAIGISRIGGLGPRPSDATVIAVSVELVERLPDTPAPVETSASRPGTSDEPTRRHISRRPTAPQSLVRERQPPSEAAPPPSHEAASPMTMQPEAAALPPESGQKTGSALADALPASASGLAEASSTRPSGDVEPRVASRRTPSWDRISQVIREHVVYPALARRRGFHGQATVAFLVTPGGMVDQLRVVESSGHDSLDTAALEAVSRSVPLPVSDQSTRIVIPIVFSLQ